MNYYSLVCTFCFSFKETAIFQLIDFRVPRELQILSYRLWQTTFEYFFWNCENIWHTLNSSWDKSSHIWLVFSCLFCLIAAVSIYTVGLHLLSSHDSATFGRGPDSRLKTKGDRALEGTVTPLKSERETYFCRTTFTSLFLILSVLFCLWLLLFVCVIINKSKGDPRL